MHSFEQLSSSLNQRKREERDIYPDGDVKSSTNSIGDNNRNKEIGCLIAEGMIGCTILQDKTLDNKTFNCIIERKNVQP
jgi:hypothetical protein